MPRTDAATGYGVRRAIIRSGCFAGVERTELASSSSAIEAAESARLLSKREPRAILGVIGPASEQSGGRPMLAWYRNGERC